MKHREMLHRQMSSIGYPRRVDGNKMGLRLRRRVKCIVFISPDTGHPPPNGPYYYGIAPHDYKHGPPMNDDGTIKNSDGWRILK